MTEKNNVRLRELLRLAKKSKHVLKEQGLGILLQRTRFEVSRMLFGVKFEGVQLGKNDTAPVKKLLRERFINARPIEWMKIDRDAFRLNIVTDSLQKDSLFGGVATSLILATLFSNKYGMPLRIITRATSSNPRAYENLLRLMNIRKPKEVEFFSDWDSMYSKSNLKLDISENDIFLATSWWTAEAIQSMNLRNKFFYILQEVETFFYPHGDERYRCESVLKSADINFIINSKLLNDYYKDNDFQQIHNNSIYFEPAFPERSSDSSALMQKKKSKYKLFFYARPNNARNLYFTGLKLLDEALLRGIIQKDEWEICFAGSSIDQIEFTNKVKPTMLGQMTWEEYGMFLKTVDLAFCLMFTPHPSYPPLDVAASGGVVITNKFDNKLTLENYSRNIICADLDIESMMQGFIQAIELAKNNEARLKNYAKNGMEQNWENALKDVFEFMNEKK
jgi:hypothetical protein